MQKFSSPIFFGGTTPTLLRQIVSATYDSPFGKVSLSSVCWSLSAKPGNKVECRIYEEWVKTHLQFKAVCGPKFMLFWGDVGNPLWFATHLPTHVYRVSFQGYRPLNLPLSCEIVDKRWFWGPRFVGGRDTPHLGHAFSNRTYFRLCGWIWLSSVQRAPRVAGEKRKKKKE